MVTRTLPEQEILVEAMAPALPGYNFSAEEWYDIMLTLRMICRGGQGSEAVKIFFEDVSRAADAMQNRLNGATVYLGQEELDRALGPVV